MEPSLQTQLADIDLLTGCRNLVSFTKGIQNNFGNESLRPITLIAIDIHQLRRVNRVHGFERGDQLLRWLGIALRDEMGSTVYRIAGDAFVILLEDGPPEADDHRARRLFQRLNDQAQQLSMDIPVVTMAVIHFAAGTILSTALVWKNLNELMTSTEGHEPFQIFDAELLHDNPEMVRAIELMAERILSLGYMLNVTFRLAYTDPVGNLPNLIATRRKLDLTLAEASAKGQRFSLCLIDGDDLKRYNAVSYSAGDQLIGQLSAALMSAVRPGDFVGRWRFGDEFIVLLPETRAEGAVALADQVRAAVKEASERWMFPVTVSIGVVEYPVHGSNVDELVSRAEQALKAAKAAGKIKQLWRNNFRHEETPIFNVKEAPWKVILAQLIASTVLVLVINLLLFPSPIFDPITRITGNLLNATLQANMLSILVFSLIVFGWAKLRPTDAGLE